MDEELKKGAEKLKKRLCVEHRTLSSMQKESIFANLKTLTAQKKKIGYVIKESANKYKKLGSIEDYSKKIKTPPTTPIHAKITFADFKKIMTK